MIREMVFDTEYETVKEMVYKTPAQNYFICMAFEMSLSIFEAIMLCEDAQHVLAMSLFHRKSGNLQVAINLEYDFHSEFGQSLLREVKAYLEQVTYKTFIVSKSIFERVKTGFPYVTIKERAEIHHLIINNRYEVEASKSAFVTDFKCLELKCEDLSEVETLYKTVFNGFASKSYMHQKIKSGRGIGYGVWKDQKLVSVAQTDFDNKIIVGVATHPAYQHLGLSRQCIHMLLNAIYIKRTEIYLQVENPAAIKFYKSLGFNAVDLILYVTNSR